MTLPVSAPRTDAPVYRTGFVQFILATGVGTVVTFVLGSILLFPFRGIGHLTGMPRDLSGVLAMLTALIAIMGVFGYVIWMHFPQWRWRRRFDTHLSVLLGTLIGDILIFAVFRPILV